jgi:hypothetical protein
MNPFGTPLLETIETLTRQHHTIYPRVPPQGIYFEELVQRAFEICGEVGVDIVRSSPTSPEHDLLVGSERISIKSETGKGTRENMINITKLCTTERDPWEANALKNHVVQHLSRYDHILMLRSIWPDGQDSIRYQLVDIPVDLLRRIGNAGLFQVGRRIQRKSLGADIDEHGIRMFHVHFDGSDGKCQVRNLLVSRCDLLRSWEQRL